MNAAAGPVAPVAVTGWSIHLPGGAGAVPAGRAAAAVPPIPPACGADQAHTVLGRKGLLYKEPATRLALCAVHRALGSTDGARPANGLRTDTAVVASSNLGNAQTVVEVARTVAREGGRGVSPMAAPNASSNVIASAVALWFHFGGPNLMVCSGDTAGLDAVALGALLIRSGRAARVVVVGAEPDDEIAAAAHRCVGGAATAGSVATASRPRLRAGAACVILEAAGRAANPAALLTMVAPPGGEPAGPYRGPGSPERVIGPGRIDPRALWGDCYGAQGVLQVALAAQLVAQDAGPVGVRCGSEADGWREAWLRAPGDDGESAR